MGLTKYGQGEIVPDPKDDKKTAAANFTEADKQALAEENRAADQD